jgi:hypothetical protein
MTRNDPELNEFLSMEDPPSSGAQKSTTMAAIRQGKLGVGQSGAGPT